MYGAFTVTWLSWPALDPSVGIQSTVKSPWTVFQVLKNQSWEKKKAASEAKNKNHNPGAKVSPGSCYQSCWGCTGREVLQGTGQRDDLPPAAQLEE